MSLSLVESEVFPKEAGAARPLERSVDLGDKSGAVRTGIEALDRILPWGGIPRGRLTEMRGPRGSGRTTFVISLIAQLAREGERSAVVDVVGDLDPGSFVAADVAPNWVWVIAPERVEDALWAADVLLRSGHFGLVVLDGLRAPVRTGVLVRLQRQARETQTALLVASEGGALSAPGGLHMTFRSLGVEWKKGLRRVTEPRATTVTVCLRKGKGEGRARFPCGSTALLGRHVEMPDRRPAPWTERRAA